MKTGPSLSLRLPVLLACALMAAAAFHGTRGLYETTEGRYAECAREMAQAGTWLEPVLNGHPHWTKPPLTYLAIRIPYSVMGPTTWAARLYLIPCYLVTIVAVWWLAFRLWRDRESAGMSALVYATAAIPMIASQTVSADYPLTVSLALTQACFWEALRKRSRWAVHLMWLFLGIAFLIKGPPALLMAPAMILVWARLPRQERRLIRLFAPSALAVFVFAGFGWYAWEAYRHPGLMGYWLHEEVVNRSLSDKFGRNPQFYMNFVVYLPILLFGTLPWSGWLAFRWREVRDRIAVPGGLKGAWSGLSDEAFWLLWSTVLPLGVFMLSRSKLPLYVLPLFVPLAAGAGRLLLAVDGRASWFRKAVLSVACGMFVLFAAGKGGVGFIRNERDMAVLHRQLTGPGGVSDPTRLALFGEKHLNGLSFYCDRTLPLVTADRLESWADAGGERFVLCRSGRQATEVKRRLGGRPAEERVLAKRWRVIRVAGAAAAPAPDL
ncbi:MAG TPA: glycosyltransferase family 39 protein [Kiritimatiellia bacterium]|nr:glycosyltransferase family 39 protein [Kiritimatiellia bacterium]HPS08134.1 glycosyltransferase family 39 protein [Kiritimatiellia bacterium]